MDSEKSPTFTNGDSPLHIAVRHNHLEDVRKILDRQSVEVNVLNSEQETPLHLACYLNHKHKEIVNVLIAFGADPFIKKFNGLTSYQMCNYDMLFLMKRLCLACYLDHKDIIKLLIAFGAHPFIKHSSGLSAYDRCTYGIVHLIERLLYNYKRWINGAATLSAGDTQLHNAVRQGQVEDVKKLIMQHVADINVINSNKETPLHIACALGHRLIVQIIISNGGNLYKRDCYNNTPIHRAVSKGHADVVDSLITEFECDPKVTGYQGRTLLHFACGAGYLEIVTMLIEKYDLRPFAADAVKQTPLHIAASQGQEQVADLLISKYNCPVDCASCGGYTPLHLACYCGHISLVKQLVLDHKADLNVCNDFLDGPLHLAALGGHTDLVKMLIVVLKRCPEVKGFRERSVLHYSCIGGSVEQSVQLITEFHQDPFIVDNNGDTPLHLAGMFGHEELVTLLIVKYNCPVDVKNIKFKTPLYLACAAGHQNVARLLVSEYKASTNVQDHQNNTPLNEAVLHKRTDLVIILVTEFNCNSFMKGFQGRSLLHQACDKGHIELAELLILEFGLDPYSCDNVGNTALHLACRGGHTDVARMLITKYQCIVDAKNSKNETPLHYACAADSFTVIRVLINECKADINAHDNDNETPIHKAALCDHTDLVLNMITEFNCSPDIKGFEHRSLLHYACYNGQTQLAVKLITEFNLDPLLTDDSGYTPLHMACWGGYVELARLLITKYKCSVHVKSLSNETLLHSACSGGHLDVVRMLVSEYNLDSTALTNDSCSPLHIAALLGHIKTVQALINDFNSTQYSKGYNGRNILHYACEGGNVELVKILNDEFKIDPMSVDAKGNTALHIAAEYNEEEVIKLLIIKYKCPVDCINFSGQTSLHIAAGKSYIDLCTTLLSEFSADRNVQDNNNDTPLSVAVMKGNAKTVYILACEYGCKLNIKLDYPLIHHVCIHGYKKMLKELISNFDYDSTSLDKERNTLLHTAAQHGKYDMVDLLITAFSIHCPVDSRNIRNETPLHLACIAGNARIAKLLLSHKATINLRDMDNDTPLRKAYLQGNNDVLSSVFYILGFKSSKVDSKLVYNVCEQGCVELLDVLLSDFFVDPHSVLDHKGNTALHVGAYYGRKEVTLLLINHGCPVDCRNYSGHTPLHLLCCNELNDSVNFLLKWFVSELKADVHIKDHKGNQPIHVSALNGCTNIMTTLIFDYGCDPEARGFKNRTLLHKALYAGQTSTAKSLIEMFDTSVHSVDSDGNTALHLSSLYGQHESVSLLLYDYHVPIFVRNKSGKTAMNLAKVISVKKVFREYISSKHHHSIQLEYEELKSLSEKIYSGEQRITRVFVLGHPESGKSTLVESLKRKGSISSFFQVPESDVEPHTAGIVPSIHQRNQSNRLLYYDFAGDREYYSSHSAILEMVSKSSIGTSVYVIVANLIKDDSTLCGELGYWLSFISYHAKNIESWIKLKVVVVLSHSDILSLADSAKKVKNIKQNLLDNASQLQEWNLDIIDVIVSNCRKPRSSRTLDYILQQISMDTPPYSLSFKSNLLNGVLEKDFKHVVACKFQDLLSHVKDTGICLPTIPSALYPIVKQLHDIGLLMIVGRRENQIEDYLLLMNTSSLTNEVHQLLFSKSAMQTLAQAVPLQYAKMGIFPESVICSNLPDHITKDCLIQLQYCHEFTHAEVGLDYSVTPNIESDNLLLYFPALCKLESEQSNWSPDPNLDFSIGWYVKCTGNLDFLPPRYLHVLLLRLTFMFALPPGSLQTSDFDLSLSVPKENCHCTMWKNGIHWLMSEGIECVIEVVNESRGVVVVVKSRKKHTYQCVRMLAQIVNVITEAKHEFCYSVSFQYHIMNSDDPSSYSKKDKLFEISKIKSALHNQDETVISESGHVTLELENLNFIKCHTYWGFYFSLKASSALAYIDEVVDKWKSLGTALQLPYPVIQGIEMDEINIESKRKELIRRWMCSTDTCGPACWWLLVKALEDRTVKMNVAAAKIREEYGDIINLQEKLLESEYSDQKPDKDFLQSFAVVVGNRWPSLASLLSLSVSDIETIKREKGNLKQAKQAHHMLKTWSSKEEATNGQLLERLRTESLLRC